MTRIIVFKPGHLDFMVNIRDSFIDDPGAKDRLEDHGNREGVYGYTFIHKDKPVAAVFASVMFGRMCDIVAITTDGIYECRFSFFRSCKSLMKSMTQKKGITRFQLTTKAGYRQASRFAESLGFKHEGVLERFGADDATYHIYGRTV